MELVATEKNEGYEALGTDVEAGLSDTNVPKASENEDEEEEDDDVRPPVNTRARAVTYSPVVPANSPTVLSWHNLTVTTKKAPPKILLNNLSGSITGGLWAIMGASGGGKTTLLSVLSLRLDTTYMEISGEFRLNGREYSKSVLKSMSAYVMQDDVLHAEFTVGETLDFASKLRLPFTMREEDRKKRVDEVIALMGIEHCRNVVVGNSRVKGISGGERKRLCVAMELLSKPKLVFLDEPTSGLDSTTSLSLMASLKHLSDAGECTVVCTIHQPQSKIFDLFDNLILMKKGEVVYQGSCNKSLRFLETIGMPCPAGVNPADHLLDVISPTRTDESAQLVDQQGKLRVPVNLSSGFEKEFLTTRAGVSWLRQLRVLTERNFLQYVRRPELILMNAIAVIVIALFIGGGIWQEQKLDQVGAATRPPSLFFGCVTQGIFASLQTVNSFPGERAVMMRERQAGSYYISSYFLAKTIVDLVTQVWPPIVFSAIVYPMLGYQSSSHKFAVYMSFMILINSAATSIAVAVTCIFVTVERSTVFLSLFFEVCRLYGGFFTSPLQLKDYPNWKFADVISFIKYGFVGVALNELSGLEFYCTDLQKAGKKCTPDGHTIIEARGYDQYEISWLAGMLVVYIVCVRIIGYIALRYVKIN